MKHNLRISLPLILMLLYGAVSFAEESVLGKLPIGENETLFGSRIQRTMTLLATSTENQRNPVKILFWGQSITAQEWTAMLMEKIKTAYPYADISYENRAIGGFTAPALVRTSVHDLYPFYPDLVVFHVYGGEKTGELERIISNIRRYTTSEVLMCNHHVAQFNPLDSDEYKKRDEEDNNSSQFTNYIAQKYNCELVDIRAGWRDYIARNTIEPKALLLDGIHLNPQGNKLMAELVGRHFRFNPSIPSPWMETVRTYEAKRFLDEGKDDEIVFIGRPWKKFMDSAVGNSPKGVLKLLFDGNRVDIVTGSSNTDSLGTARIRIDGKSPSKFSSLYEFTRPSKAFGSWMPALKRVSHYSPLVREDWTLRITKITDDAKYFEYEVTGSVTGPDGKGNSKDVFVSKSKRVGIEPEDFMITWTQEYFKKKCPDNFEITWSVQTSFKDTYAPKRLTDRSQYDMATVAAGIENGKHVLEIIPNGDGDIPIKEIVIHRPPLK